MTLSISNWAFVLERCRAWVINWRIYITNNSHRSRAWRTPGPSAPQTLNSGRWYNHMVPQRMVLARDRFPRPTATITSSVICLMRRSSWSPPRSMADSPWPSFPSARPSSRREAASSPGWWGNNEIGTWVQETEEISHRTRIWYLTCYLTANMWE